jgi:hypothetical protein
MKVKKVLVLLDDFMAPSGTVRMAKRNGAFISNALKFVATLPFNADSRSTEQNFNSFNLVSIGIIDERQILFLQHLLFLADFCNQHNCVALAFKVSFSSAAAG